jgi:hypothetical protein
MLIKDHQSYTAFFRKAATNHKQILHSANEDHFARMNLSSHPVLAREDITEFLRSIKNKLHFPALLLNAFSARYSDSDSKDAKRLIIQGEFFILDRFHKDDWAMQEQVFDNTEEIGRDILSFLDDYYDENIQEGVFDWTEAMQEKISNLEVDSLAGTKFYFTISIPHQVALNLDENAFNIDMFS